MEKCRKKRKVSKVRKCDGKRGRGGRCGGKGEGEEGKSVLGNRDMAKTKGGVLSESGKRREGERAQE